MNNRWAPAALGAGAGLATFVGYLPGLGRSLDYDSADTVGVFIRPGPPWAAFRRQVVFNNHPFFSFLEQLVRVTTGRVDAATMRVLPITFGAATVGILTWYSARRFRAIAGIAAGVVVAVNPTFSELSRAVRGYSLLALCALVSTIVVIDELMPTASARPAFRRGSGVVYVGAAAVGIATHLFMVPVVVTHLGMVAGTRRLDERWRQRFLWVALLSALAYSGIARAMLDSSGQHSRVFQPRLPIDVAESVLGGGWAAVVAGAVVVCGLAIVARTRAVRIGLVVFAAQFALLWLVYQSSALTPRFLVFLVPLAGFAVAAAVAWLRPLALLAGVSVVLAVTSLVDGYGIDPTSYRQAADVIRAVDAAGGRSCVVDVGVPPMQAYADTPRDFAAITDSGQLQSCDVVVVATWWHTDADYYRTDRDIIAAAEQRFPNRTVLRSDDSALVLSIAPLSRWKVSV